MSIKKLIFCTLSVILLVTSVQQSSGTEKGNKSAKWEFAKKDSFMQNENDTGRSAINEYSFGDIASGVGVSYTPDVHYEYPISSDPYNHNSDYKYTQRPIVSSRKKWCPYGSKGVRCLPRQDGFNFGSVLNNDGSSDDSDNNFDISSIGGLAGLAGLLGLAGLKGLGPLALLKLPLLLPALLPILAPALLPLLIPLVLLLGVLIAFLPVPVITIPTARRAISATFSQDLLMMAESAANNLGSEECVERISCEIATKAGKGYKILEWIKSWIEVIPDKNKWLKKISTGFRRKVSSAHREACSKFICKPLERKIIN